MLYMIRHGQTDWNKVHKLQGTTDVPLNETGRQMARDAKKTLDEVEFDACYVSPLSRAVETAEILLEGRDIPIIYDDRLKEISFGIFEGTENFMKDPNSPVYKLFSDPANFDGEGNVEKFADLYARTGNFLEEVAQPLCRKGKNVLVVAHGAMCLSIYNQLNNVPLAQFWDNLMKNCELCAVKDEDILNYKNRI